MKSLKIVFILLAGSLSLFAQIKESSAKIFTFEIVQNLTGSPEYIFDKITGDISPWWDHTFSEKPVKLFIEPKPGGRFYETFNDSGDGVIHATVTGVERGKFLRMDGPLGLAGRAVQMVTTYHFKNVNFDSTELKVEVHLSGEIDMQLAQVVQKVWNHFIVEQFVPYIKHANSRY